MSDEVEQSPQEVRTPPQTEIEDGVVQLRFADRDGTLHDIDAAEMAEVLQGLVEFTSEMGKKGLFGDGVPPTVRVRTPQKGSFVIEAVLQFLNDNPEAAGALYATASGAVVQALNIGFRKLRGETVKDYTPMGDEDVKITWSSDTVSQVPVSVWNQLRDLKRPTKRALRKLMAPLSDDVETLEVRDATVDEATDDVLQAPPAIVATKEDYRTAVAEVTETGEEDEIFDVEAMIESLDFRPGVKWRVKTSRGTRLATIEDEEFILGLDRGDALHKNDLFQVKLRETRTTKDGRTSTEWALIEVRRKRRGGDDDHDASGASLANA